MKKATLVLCDGTVFEGQSLGVSGAAVGEVVFNTSMTGYQEILTDPSYYGQIVCMTYPLIGNYGINKDDFESATPFVKGFIVREMCRRPSNFRYEKTLGSYLEENNIIGIAGIDTRRLTRILRESGVKNGVIYTDGKRPDMETVENYEICGAVDAVTAGKRETMPASGEKLYRVALMDYGAKWNIARSLSNRHCEVDILPSNTTPAEIIGGGYDGIMLSNGPGDPAENTKIIENLKPLIKSGIPMFGICLGHQLLALAIGAKTAKLKYGHRGSNHPVRELSSGRTYITCQNHGYAVLAETVDESVAEISHLNLNDNTTEGLCLKNAPVFSVQYHPEASAGPRDAGYLFDRFIDMMKRKGKGD